MQESIHPFDDWIVVEPITERITEGGIYIPESAEDDPTFMSKTGTVVAGGPGMLLSTTGERADLQSRVGDKVEFLSNVAKRVKIGDKDRYVVRDRNVLFRYVKE